MFGSPNSVRSDGLTFRFPIRPPAFAFRWRFQQQFEAQASGGEQGESGLGLGLIRLGKAKLTLAGLGNSAARKVSWHWQQSAPAEIFSRLF